MTTANTRPTVEEIARIVKCTALAFNASAPFQAPPRTPCDAIESDSTPIFVAIRGKEHRMTAMLKYPKVLANPSIEVTDERVLKVNVELKRPTDADVVKVMHADILQSEKRIFSFPAAWEPDTDPEDQKVSVTCCVLHFSDAEVKRLLELEVPNSHLVFCVVTSDEAEDMAGCDHTVATTSSESGKPSVMQLKWTELKSQGPLIVDRPWIPRGEKRKRLE